MFREQDVFTILEMKWNFFHDTSEIWIPTTQKPLTFRKLSKANVHYIIPQQEL